MDGGVIMKCKCCAMCAMMIPMDAKVCPYCRKAIGLSMPAILATKDRKGLSALDVPALLTKVVQEQQKTIDAMNKEIA
jgi:hypothetical protein